MRNKLIRTLLILSGIVIMPLSSCSSKTTHYLPISIEEYDSNDNLVKKETFEYQDDYKTKIYTLNELVDGEFKVTETKTEIVDEFGNKVKTTIYYSKDSFMGYEYMNEVIYSDERYTETSYVKNDNKEWIKESLSIVEYLKISPEKTEIKKVSLTSYSKDNVIIGTFTKENEYDDQGRLIKTSYVSTYDWEEGYTEFRYNDEEHTIEEISYIKEDSSYLLTNKITSKIRYLENDKREEEINYFDYINDKWVLTKVTNEILNADGSLIYSHASCIYNGDKVSYSKYTNEYDKNNNLICYSTFSKEGNDDYKILSKIDFIYNKEGNLMKELKETEYDEEHIDGVCKEKYFLTYDNKNNLAEVSLFTVDNNGNMILEKQFKLSYEKAKTTLILESEEDLFYRYIF